MCATRWELFDEQRNSIALVRIKGGSKRRQRPTTLTFEEFELIVGDHPFRLLSRPAFGAGDLDLGERGFRKRNFCRRGTFKPNSQRKTATVDQYRLTCDVIYRREEKTFLRTLREFKFWRQPFGDHASKGKGENDAESE